MQARDEFGHFLSSESEIARLGAIENLMNAASTAAGGRELLLWRLLSSFPTKFELVKLAGSSLIDKRANGSWAIATHMLLEADQDVVGNALNSLTFSNNRALGHRTLRFFETRERPQRVLYCLARYAEETIDRRFSDILSRFMESQLSDAFLARSFNALFRLGMIDRLAIQVAMDLVNSHIDATNMDRKAAVSAIVYLCFAGNQDDVENLKSVQNKVTIPELRRLLNWGLYELNGFEKQNFDYEAAKNFFKRAANLSEPNFTGYGCFAHDALIEGAKLFLKELEPENYSAATRTLLALGHPEIIDILAANAEIGLEAIQKRSMGELKQLWKHYLPTHSKLFTESAKNPANMEFWNERDPEIIYVVLEPKDFLTANETTHSKPSKAEPAAWQQVFEECLSDPQKTERCLDLLVAQLLCLERKMLDDEEDDEKSAQSLQSFEKLIFENIKKVAQNWKSDAQLMRSLSHAVYGVLIAGQFNQRFVETLYECLPFQEVGWEFGALCLHEDAMSEAQLFKVFEKQMLQIESSLVNPKLDLDEVTEWCVAFLQGVLLAGSKAKAAVPQETLKSIDSLAKRLQSIFDTVDSAAPEPDQDSEQHSDDWGHAIKDKPVLRWNAVLQVWLAKNLDEDSIEEYDATLRDGLRVAPHVEKRWITCALAKISSDDAIKAILYQALQHVDQEFVAHSIRQLLKSPHRRAQQALIRCVGRNTISDDLKFTILDEISLENPQDLLQELKTLEILRLPPHIDDAIRDAVGRVAALVGQEQEKISNQTSQKIARFASADVESIIKGFLPEAELLSVDTRSALRTAEMILIQSKEWGQEAVDLSPIVNMHCKAVELTMRETFEGLTDAIIRKGDLSRKLDILGYARPIPEKMQIFEDHLAQLQIVRTIPYFSKFKLRKMLRAICLYRPGKRFTLDGPKAFALLFLVGSRKECPFGLAGSIPLSFKNDNELFEFIKLVHSLQDSRNRAVHEGLTWEAQDEIESMRSQAYKIIETCIMLSKEIRKKSLRPQGGLVGVGA